jgi:alcohol dehydrogenase, propanol-preferring
MMKAAVVHRFDQALSIDELPMPTPEHGQVLVKAETSRRCHTDIHADHLR